MLLIEQRQHSHLLLPILLAASADGQDKTTRAGADPRYGVAFASFAPLNTEIFVAAADGSDPRPLLPHPNLDYNASFSPDGFSQLTAKVADF